MTVVCDTSVLCCLTLIDCVEVLPRRFGTVTIPSEVAEECLHPSSSLIVTAANGATDTAAAPAKRPISREAPRSKGIGFKEVRDRIA